MIRGRHLIASLAALVAASTSAFASPTLIDAQPSGKRVLIVDDKEISRSSDDKVLLYIEGDSIYTDPAGSPVLVVDDDAIRHSMGGIKLAEFDGSSIRHSDVNGPVLMDYRHPDICPDSAANRIFTVDGPELSKVQLVAVLYALKPTLFDLTPEEKAAKEKAFKEAGEEADREAAADHVAGTWEVLNGHGPVEKISKGAITFGTKIGDVYPAKFDYSAAGGPSFMGVAASEEIRGDRCIFTAYGTEKAIGLCVYEIDGGNLKGTWYPWYFDGDAKNLGTEVLKGGSALDGDFKIVSAKAPTTGAPYEGKVTIKQQKIVGASDDDQPYTIVWTLGDVKVYGIGIRAGNHLYVASGAAKDVNIGKFKIGNGTFTGDFFKLGSTEMGSTAASK